jgi:UDP-glucose 4-epimerase
VTGAGGFVGANLVRRLLADGCEVVAAARPDADGWRLREVAGELELEAVDLADPAAAAALVRRTRPRWLFHLAAHGAYSWQTDVQRIVAVNVQGTAALVDAAREAGVDAFVHAGSSSEYGLKDHPPAEDEALEPNSAYAVAKAAATHYCRFVARRDGTRIATLRLYSVYGPWEDPGRLIPRLVASGLDGRLPPLVAPDTARDFVYVDDVCDAFVRAAAAPGLEPGAVLNVGSGRQSTLRDVVAAARDVLGIAAEPQWGTAAARSWDTSVWVADPRAAAATLGWRATTALRDGLRATADWLQAAGDRRERYREVAA